MCTCAVKNYVNLRKFSGKGKWRVWNVLVDFWKQDKALMEVAIYNVLKK